MNLLPHPGCAPGYAGSEVAWAHAYGASSDASSRRAVRAILERAARSHAIASDSIFDDALRCEFDETFRESLTLIARAVEILDAADATSGIDSKAARHIWSRAAMDVLKIQIPGTRIDVAVHGLKISVDENLDQRTCLARLDGTALVVRRHATDRCAWLASQISPGDEARLRAEPGLYRRALRNSPRLVNHRNDHFILAFATNPHHESRSALRIESAWTVSQDAIPDDFL